jgi:hypothetical protein
MLEDLKFIAEVCKNVYESTLPINMKISASRMYQSAETDCQMYLIELSNSKGYIIAYRGTDSDLDWKHNYKFKLKKLEKPDVRVHRGFYNQYKSLEDIIHEYIEFNKLSSSKFMIIGHSLGGAVASICSLLLKYKYPEMVVKCYTFGSPRAGDKSFANLHEKLVPETLRVVNCNDPVTMVPSQLFYRHVGILILLRQKKKLSIKCMCNNMKKYIFSILICDPTESPVEDHNIERYICKIDLLVN